LVNLRSGDLYFLRRVFLRRVVGNFSEAIDGDWTPDRIGDRFYSRNARPTPGSWDLPALRVHGKTGLSRRARRSLPLGKRRAHDLFAAGLRALRDPRARRRWIMELDPLEVRRRIIALIIMILFPILALTIGYFIAGGFPWSH
jgi:hypothetical protein